MNRFIRVSIFILTGIFALLLTSCKKGVSLSETDFKEMYSSSSDIHQPQFQVYHASDSESEIYYMFENKSLKYVTDNQSSSYMANVKISWQLYSDFSSKEVIDSSSFVKFDTAATSGLAQLQGMFKLTITTGRNYILKITTTDLNTKAKTISFLNLNKRDITSRQFFKVILKENNSILFRNYFYKHENLAIVYRQKSNPSVVAKNYKTVFPVSSPPFSLSKANPFNFDDFYTLEVGFINDTLHFQADEPGIYHFGITSDERYSGLTLFQYSKEFPEINTTQEMLDPLRFLTSMKEFGKMRKYKDPKKAVDQFWLSTAKDSDKSRKLVKGFYQRVESANYYYTSFKEGWKTDRGIIFIVFGPPSIVYRSLTGESWTYGEQSNYKSLTFNFSKVNNPFTNNDYVLQRSTVYKNPWYRAVDTWRQGKVTSLDY
ncbi:MAG: GWxTD domain-containing protein [Salibacteraceae bacterium]|jgi:GWxTD domain-containing protein